MRLGYRMLVDLRSYTEYRSYYTGDYESPAILKAIRRIITADSVVLDVGANVGFIAVPLAQTVYRHGMFFAFEPQEQNFERLQENLRFNGVLRDGCVFRLGLSDRAVKANLSLRGDFQSGATTGNAAIVEADDHGFDVQEIELGVLDEIFPSLKCERLDFIKVDIEGHEMAFLSGASRVIRRFRPVIFSEINDWYYAQRGAKASELFSAWADESDYEIAMLQGDRVSFVTLAHSENLQIDVFLVPREKREGFLLAINRAL